MLAIDAVNRLPLDIDKSWIADNDTIIRKFQIDRRFLAKVATHSCLCIFRGPIDEI